VYPGQNIDSLNPPPEPNQLGVGTISIGFYGDSEATLGANGYLK